MTAPIVARDDELYTRADTGANAETKAQLISWGAGLILKSVIVVARWAAAAKNGDSAKLMDSPIDEMQHENLVLREDVARLTDLVSILRDQLREREHRSHATIKHRLQVLRHIQFFDFPKRKAHEYFSAVPRISGQECSTAFFPFGVKVRRVRLAAPPASPPIRIPSPVLLVSVTPAPL